ncbi:MAG: hypothetical protein MZU84_03275 [Sphingobacterium sp.]|nr:hypothetical protein [Sphingobacterium sp.]
MASSDDPARFFPLVVVEALDEAAFVRREMIALKANEAAAEISAWTMTAVSTRGFGKMSYVVSG